jgi:5-(carboxyamino)imidazole ribonucleotide synthase
MTKARRFQPGHTLGIMGGGQLGRMLAQSARQHGYRVVVLNPEAQSPAGQLADEEIVAPFEDLSAVGRFAARADAVTFEFENVPAAAAKAAVERAVVRPDPSLLFVAQNRVREKSEVQRAGFPVTPFRPIRARADLRAAWEEIGGPAILKTASAGYDGKGQRRATSLQAAEAAFDELGGVECVLEARVDFEREVSVVVARSAAGDIADYGALENDHVDHILDTTVAPARVDTQVAERARALARGVAAHLELVGVACVELFVRADGELLFNELAPRPHNSGHLTIEACETSQFEQQLRAVCGLPLGSTALRAPAAAMANLLGDLWTYDLDGAVMGEPSWSGALARPGVHLHLYGKRVPRLGRKMGHLTTLGSTPAEALAKVLAARSALLASA